MPLAVLRSAPAKPAATQEVVPHFVPVSASEAAANFRLCAVLREKADPAMGHFILLRQTTQARALLGALCDSDGLAHEWLELWIQDVEAEPAGETLAPSNLTRDRAWEHLVERLRGADPEGCYATAFEKQAARPVFVDVEKWQPWHPATESGEIQVCTDDAALRAAGLPAYGEGLARFGRARGGAFISLNAAGHGAGGSTELQTVAAGANLAPLNPGGGRMFARRLSPLGLEEFAELLGGGAWAGLANGRLPFPLAGVYRELEDDATIRAGGQHFYGSRRNQAGRLAEVLCLKLLLLEQCTRAVREEVRRSALPMLNLTPDSFAISLGATGGNLPFCWTSRVSLVQPGDAMVLDVPSSRTRYFATRHAPAASIYRPEELGVPRQGTGQVRLRRVYTSDEGLAADGTLSSHERLGVQPNELLRLRLPQRDAGHIELIGYVDPEAALAPGEAGFRTVPLQLDDVRSAALSSYEGIPFSRVPFEVLQPLNSPCDIYSLGVLGLRLLYAGSDLSLPAILDTALSLLRAAGSEAVGEAAGKGLEERLFALFESDSRWMEALGPQHLIRPSKEGGAVVAGTLPLQVWCRVLAAILCFFPGRAPESLCRDLADAPTLAPHTPFDSALRALQRALDTARALFLSDWQQNEEILELLRPHLPQSPV